MDKEYKKFLQMELRRMPQPTPEEKKERKRFATQCGHVSRRLYRDERLTRDLLELRRVLRLRRRLRRSLGRVSRLLIMRSI